LARRDARRPEGIEVARLVAPPDAGEQPLVGQDPACIGDEHVEQPPFGGGRRVSMVGAMTLVGSMVH
jgi:hypothetical protein